MTKRHESVFQGLKLSLPVLFVALSTLCAGDEPRPEDDRTYRPTVVIRQGGSQGSGTLIAAMDGTGLVLTASHVVAGTEPIHVELHRYNLGLERIPVPGAWPRLATAIVVAAHKATDLAILRIEAPGELPFVARLGGDENAPPEGTSVLSVGIDRGIHFSGWTTEVIKLGVLEIGPQTPGSVRPFLITARPPEHGRSGGGLFLSNGDLIGVCIGHAEVLEGRRSGVFAPADSIRRLLRDSELDVVVERAAPAPTEEPPRTAITPTQSPAAP